MKKACYIFIWILTLCLAAFIGWRLGLRDGIAMAYGDVSIPLSSYYQAVSAGENEKAAASLDILTGETAIQLLQGRHSFPLYFTFPYKSEMALRNLSKQIPDIEKKIKRGALTSQRYPFQDLSMDYLVEIQKYK